YGLFYIIPGGGAFGIVWTLVAGVITVMNALNVFTKNGVSTATIHVSDEKDSNSVEERLKELDSLYQKNLISRDEYDENRKKILNEL
ncbi:MAG: SHOCT domain-containing protein, partial [Longicatena sp.]